MRGSSKKEERVLWKILGSQLELLFELQTVKVGVVLVVAVEVGESEDVVVRVGGNWQSGSKLGRLVCQDLEPRDRKLGRLI